MTTTALAVVVLAAGRGTRFPGVASKVLVPLAAKPLLLHVLEQAKELTPSRTIVVVGHGRDAVEAVLRGRDVETAVQGVPLGTGHALMSAASALAGFEGAVLVLNGDVPRLRATTLRRLLARLDDARVGGVILSAVLDDGASYGRVRRGADGRVLGIVEAVDADAATLAIREINVGAYAFRAPLVFAVLAALGSANAQGEIYLTDSVAGLVSRGYLVEAVVLDDPGEARGVNSPADLAMLEANHAG